jgi:uncharacterized protein (TIGR02246 family)
MSDDSLQRRIDRLESRAAIAELCAAYCAACDDRDMARLRSLFTEDIVFDTGNGTMRAEGAAAVMAMFQAMLEIRGPSFHWTHDRSVAFDATDPDRASGTVAAHAETTPHGVVSIAAIRYTDLYRRLDGRWLFAKRRLAFLYYLPMQDYTARLGRLERFYSKAGWQDADYPESFASWKEFYSVP